MDFTHIVLAALAGAGGGLAWGYRTALAVSQGRDGRVSAPKPPRGPDASSLPVPISNARREELTR